MGALLYEAPPMFFAGAAGRELCKKRILKKLI